MYLWIIWYKFIIYNKVLYLCPKFVYVYKTNRPVTYFGNIIKLMLQEIIVVLA